MVGIPRAYAPGLEEDNDLFALVIFSLVFSKSNGSVRAGQITGPCCGSDDQGKQGPRCEGKGTACSYRVQRLWLSPGRRAQSACVEAGKTIRYRVLGSSSMVQLHAVLGEAELPPKLATTKLTIGFSDVGQSL
jgi:hypothetical protein